MELGRCVGNPGTLVSAPWVSVSDLLSGLTVVIRRNEHEFLLNRSLKQKSNVNNKWSNIWQSSLMGPLVVNRNESLKNAIDKE